jgi:hypothetical protein
MGRRVATVSVFLTVGLCGVHEGIDLTMQIDPETKRWDPKATRRTTRRQPRLGSLPPHFNNPAASDQRGTSYRPVYTERFRLLLHCIISGHGFSRATPTERWRGASCPCCLSFCHIGEATGKLFRIHRPAFTGLCAMSSRYRRRICLGLARRVGLGIIRA